jgi:hypothetical protein
MSFTVPCPSTKGLPFSVVMATCNAPRDASDSRFRATPPVPFTTDAVTKPSLSGPGHKPHAQTPILGPDGRDTPAYGRGSRNPRWHRPRWTGPWIVWSPQFTLTRISHASPTSCVCLCDNGPATPEPTNGVPRSRPPDCAFCSGYVGFDIHPSSPRSSPSA